MTNKADMAHRARLHGNIPTSEYIHRLLIELLADQYGVEITYTFEDDPTTVYKTGTDFFIRGKEKK